MKLLSCLLLTVFMVLPLTVSAQETNSDLLLSQIDPDEIFASDVEVLDRTVGLPISAWRGQDVSKVVRVLDSARVVEVKQPGLDWQAIPYASGIDHLNEVAVRTDGTILFNQPHEAPDLCLGECISLPGKGPFWILNPETQQFTQAEVVCSGFAKAVPKYGLWVDATDPIVHKTALCNTEKGEYLFLARGDKDYWSVIASSPDNQWVLLSHYENDDPYNNTVIYSFDRASRQRLKLGRFASTQDLFVDRWLTPTRGLLFRNDWCENCSRQLLEFDVTEPGSLTFIMSGHAEYADNPSRYEYLYSFWESKQRTGWYSSCGMELFDLTAQLYSDLYFAGDCDGRVLRHGDDYLFVTDLGPKRGRALFALNTQTQAKRILYSDKDLLGLDSISPDGRYVLLLMNDGTYRRPQPGEFPDEYMDPFEYGQYGPGSPKVLIYDLVWQQARSPVTLDPGVLTWFGSASFYLYDAYKGADHLKIISVTETGIERIDMPLGSPYWFFDASPDASPDGRQLLLNKRGFCRVMVYSVPDRHFIPVLRLPDELDCEVQASWKSNDILEIALVPYDESPENERVTYTVRILKP